MSVTTVVEKKGRVVIPSRLRKQLDIKAGMELEVNVKSGGISASTISNLQNDIPRITSRHTGS